MPNGERDAVEYLDVPESVWRAESVFLDEISRCRPEVQNKLFSIVHERRVQGIQLAKLRYRWAAMNPPASDALDAPERGDIDSYEGSLPLIWGWPTAFRTCSSSPASGNLRARIDWR